MKRIMNIMCKKAGRVLVLFMLACSTVSCDSILDFPKEDCSIEYRVRFKYDYNMKYANAFAQEVKTVTLYAFDEEGRFVYQRTEEGDILKADNYSMKVDIDPGKYHMVVWAGLDDKSFAVPLLLEGKSDLEELTVKTNRITQTRAGGESENLVREKLTSLFHGESTQVLTRAAQQNIITIPLVKNTNSVRIILQQMEGAEIDVNKFNFAIYDDNGWMNYDNSLLKDDLLTYQPYYKAQGVTTRTLNKSGEIEETTPVSVAIAEISVARLMENKKPRLRIMNKETGKTVLSIPLVDYLLLTEQESHNMSSQEYLDRQDEYSMTFFLDSNMNWLNTQIIINGWTVRLNESEI